MSYISRKRKRTSKSSRYAGGRPKKRTVITQGLSPARTGGYYGVLARKALNEKKVIDVDPANYAFDTTGSVTLLNGVATGTDFTDRIGRKIVLKSMYLRGILKPVDNNVGNTLCRLIIVYDMQTNGAAPAITDVLKSASPSAQLNMNNRDRFKILVDRAYALGGVSDATTQSFSSGKNVYSIKKYKKCNLETLYNGTTNAVGSIATGSIYMITIGDQVAGNGGQGNISSRIRFVDA